MNPSFARTWSAAWSDRRIRLQIIITFPLLVITLAVLAAFLNWVEARPGVILADPVLALFAPVNLNWLTFGLIYAGIISGVAFLSRHPHALLVAFQSYILMVAVRILAMFVVPLAAPPTPYPLMDPFVQYLGTGKMLTQDLFFSGHTSTLFLLFLTAQGQTLKRFFLVCTLAVGACVILQHVHYAVDVLVAPFVAYSCFRIVTICTQRWWGNPGTGKAAASRTGEASRASAVIVLALILFSHEAGAQSTLVHDSLFSSSLNRTKRFMAIVPAHAGTTQRFAVLYLLHGYSGDETDWTSKTSILNYSQSYPVIIIMPAAENSWYVNSIGEPAKRFEDYMMKDLPEYIAGKYPADTTRQAIAGLSMGGYGSVMLALRHPRAFLFAGGLSSAISVPRAIGDPDLEGLKGLREIFGPPGSSFRQSHDVVALASSLPQINAPYLYLVAGIQDEFRTFLPVHRELTGTLQRRALPYEYHEIPGRHNWQFWDREVSLLLKRMAEVMNLGAK